MGIVWKEALTSTAKCRKCQYCQIPQHSSIPENHEILLFVCHCLIANNYNQKKKYLRKKSCEAFIVINLPDRDYGISAMKNIYHPQFYMFFPPLEFNRKEKKNTHLVMICTPVFKKSYVYSVLTLTLRANNWLNHPWSWFFFFLPNLFSYKWNI